MCAVIEWKSRKIQQASFLADGCDPGRIVAYKKKSSESEL